MTSKLCELSCVPCRGGVPPLDEPEISELLGQLNDDWEVVDKHHLTRTFKTPDFVTGLEFVNSVGAVAERQGHHPDISLSWGKVTIAIHTHKIDGLTESDFVLAAKIDVI
ncbi:MAG: 4a-hydroxytetrahydrobiopterin dehydratase [Phycisphaerae bacterium]|nr:4a-hydroxytetrahydrobiopterin dehydratase [Phycisphaerae bacterium]